MVSLISQSETGLVATKLSKPSQLKVWFGGSGPPMEGGGVGQTIRVLPARARVHGGAGWTIGAWDRGEGWVPVSAWMTVVGVVGEEDRSSVY
jgi:hypothetical protein